MTRLAALLVLSCCLTVPCGCVPDEDDDLLTDAFEKALGTNYQIADSDGDGFSDAEEYLAYFDPMNEDDYPWEGGYVRLPTPQNHLDGEELDSDGWHEGQVSRDWTGEDQFADLIDLHDFYGQVIVVDMGAEWCGPCQAAAPTMQQEFEDNSARGFVVINLLLDGEEQTQQPDPERWAEGFDLTFPIVGDHAQDIAKHYFVADGTGSFSIPNFTIIDRNLQIRSHYQSGAVDWEMVDDLLDEDPPEVEWPLPPDTVEVREELGIDSGYEDPLLQANMERGEELAGRGGGGGSQRGGADGTFVEPSQSNGDYAGPPFGGEACNQAGPGPGVIPPSGLLLALLGLRRRD